MFPSDWLKMKIENRPWGRIPFYLAEGTVFARVGFLVQTLSVVVKDK